MAYLENNSTEILLLANQEFVGTTVQIPADFIAAQVSFNVAGSGGTLQFLHSYNGINFQTYGDEFNFLVGEHSKEVSLKAQFFRIKYINGNANQTNFHLHTRIGKGGAFDGMEVNATGGGGGGGAVQISDSNGNPLLGTDNALNVNIVSGGSGGGIIQGKNLNGGAGIDINADVKVQSTVAINRLYTHSSLYGEYTDGFSQKSDIALSCDDTGKLNVNMVGGNTFNGVIKGLSTATGNPAVSFSADSFTPPAGASINKLYTRSSLYGSSYSEEDNQEFPVQVSDSGEIFVKSLTSLQTEISNNVIVSPIVQSQSFDVVLNDDLYADSTGNNDPPFQRDIRGHQGWYYINTDPAKSSNVYYYFNLPINPLTLQSDVLLENINFFYAVITLDFVGSLSSNLPFLVMGSQATGTNDHIPNFANTTYAYTLPVGYTYITGEPIVIYWSDSVDKKPLESFMPNLRRIKLNNPIISGTGESTKLAYFSVNNATNVQQKQEYTLIGAGYKFNSAQGEQGGVLNDATFDFLFTAQTQLENNLAKLTFNENNELLVVNNTTTPTIGVFGNIANNITLTTGESTTVYPTGNNFKNNCILTVSDTSITSTGYYSINVSSNGGANTEFLGIIQPIVSLSGLRGGSTTLNLSPYDRIQLTNESGVDYNNVYVSLYST